MRDKLRWLLMLRSLREAWTWHHTDTYVLLRTLKTPSPCEVQNQKPQKPELTDIFRSPTFRNQNHELQLPA
ncbi:hypothetical protein GGU10DRAFT_384074 [Lentinula aff. detonsa]|uniref:Uncharacterized protein n=1 Tax=Lentinula aff. detonsa TaxID=2804958 RepID=A0AA38TYG2_9AGAR|nr:hypothetical protein GGU10DRAFT_384074 [Lentinula aff. detonsa]